MTYLPAQRAIQNRLRELRYDLVDQDTHERFPLVPTGVSGSSITLDTGDWRSRLSDLLQDPLILEVIGPSGQTIDSTYFQTGELLDELFSYNGPLGSRRIRDGFDFSIWAPTARSLQIFLYEDPDQEKSSPSETLTLKRQAGGAWEGRIPLRWKNRFYLLSVEVFTPETGNIEKNLVTDPYSFSLSRNARKSQLVDLEDPELKPPGWDSRRKSTGPEEAVLYELHVRDFSAADDSVPEIKRGTFAAFSLPDSNGIRHLQNLAAAGITHLHLMPVMDFASVDEDPARQLPPQMPDRLLPDSPLQQEALSRVRGQDSFNWGYDPFHYFVPDGSYSTEAQGSRRILEFRQMIQSLNRLGLRVVLDVVYNHTFSSGIASESVLDKIVPGYYYRLDERGRVRNSSCCSDTASERKMMERLMIDSVVHWTQAYKVDGFRFDLMNLHPVGTMERLRAELNRVAGHPVLLYGEAWSFGSLMDARPSDAFTQEKSYGRGIAIFNDRIRDALRGGTTDSHGKSDQGFATGLFYDFNHEPANSNTPLDLGQQRERLLWFSDVVKVGLAGNLRDFELVNFRGDRIRGGQLRFRDGATGFASTPQETINYVSAHDGYSLWDSLQAKLPFFTPGRGTASISERVDRQKLLLSFIAFSQGIPFFDAGSELLRSKSGDQNSYDSGDWFNRLDLSLRSNTWGTGLPPAWSNAGDWAFWSPRLSEPSLQAQYFDILSARDAFFAFLKVRKSSALFRLKSLSDVQRRIRFLNGERGPMQIPGVIVMELSDRVPGLPSIDPSRSRLVVAWNVTNREERFFHDTFVARSLRMHPNLASRAAFDSAQGLLVLPPRSVSIWESPEE